MSMAVSGVEAVLEFFRKNGFSEAESALREDVIDIDKGDLGSFSFDYRKIFFPMVPPPPPVRVRECSKSSFGSSKDEFVSLGSSTSDVCSSGTCLFLL